MMGTQEEFFIIAIVCAALPAAFLAGWGTLIISASVNAVLKGQNVKQAIQPLLEEW